MDFSDPRVEGLAKFLAMQQLIQMTGMQRLEDVMPDALTNAMESVWSERINDKDEKIKTRFRIEATKIIHYLDTNKVMAN